MGAQRWGLNLLLTRGLAAWIQAGLYEPEDHLDSLATTTPSTAMVVRLSEPVQQQMAAVLAEMILQRAL